MLVTANELIDRLEGENRLLRGRVAYLEADRQVVAEAVARERERCAQLAEKHWCDCGTELAALLREQP